MDLGDGMATTTKNLQAFQEIIDDQETMETEIAELREQKVALEEQLAAEKEENKDLKQFVPLLQNIPVSFYKIQLHDSALMRQFIGRMKDIYGPRFGKAIASMNDKDATDTKFARQCLDSATLACIRYCVAQNSRWNDMVAHCLS